MAAAQLTGHKNYYDLGYLTGQMAVRVIKGEVKTAAMPIESVTKGGYVINGTVAQKIGDNTYRYAAICC